MKKILKIILLSFLGLFILILIIPTDNSTEQVKSEDQSQTLAQEQVQKQDTIQKDDLSSVSEQTDEQADVQTLTQTNKESATKEETENTQLYYIVTRVIDGDTIEVEIDGVKEKLRLIGIDTPETVDPRKPVECFGKEASNKMKAFVDGKQVRLEQDPTQENRGKYGRLLRYAFLPDGTHINDTMIREGYAYEYTYQIPYQYQAEFKQAEKEARDNKRGLWADGVCEDEVLPIQSETTPPHVPPTPLTTQLESSPPVQPEPTPTPIASTCDCSGNIYNCGDFKKHQEAQTVFECCMAQVGKDIHKLDGMLS